MRFIVLDFGSSYVDKIGRRFQEIGHDFVKVDSQISSCDVLKYQPDGIVLSGSPDTVFAGGRKIEKEIYELGVPVLGICYGMQLTNYIFNGIVERSKTPEINQLVETKLKQSPLFENIPNDCQMFMYHNDEVVALADGFENVASTEKCRNAACQNLKRRIFCTQFHPEDEKNVYGKQLFINFANICKENREN